MKNINMYVTGTVDTSFVLPILVITATLCVATAGVLTLISWRNCKAIGAEHVMCLGSSEKELTFLR